MAKKSKRDGINKSQAIRDYATANGQSSPKEIVAGLKAQGVDVSSQFVSTILSNAKRKGKKRRGRKPGAAAAAPAATDVSLKSLLAAKKFVGQFGSVKEARAAVNAIAELLG